MLVGKDVRCNRFIRSSDLLL